MADEPRDAPPAAASASVVRRLLRQGRALAMWRWPLAPAFALCLAVAAAGIGLPAARPSPAALADPGDLRALPSVEAESEDLSAFLASRRWGISLAEARSASPPAAAAGINPALAALGFVGVTFHGGAFRALVLVDGAVVRLRAGDALPDGQTLTAVDGNTVAVRAPGGDERVLVLFPPVAAP